MLGSTMKSTRHTSPRSLRSTQRGRIAWFLVVGSVAAAVHWGVVVFLVGHLGWSPLVANIVGWLTAFIVSFSGHHWLTFRGHGNPAQASALRFFAVSAGGFAINEAAYAVLMQWGGIRYDAGLFVVLVAVAGATYLLGRQWAFIQGKPAP